MILNKRFNMKNKIFILIMSLFIIVLIFPSSYAQSGYEEYDYLDNPKTKAINDCSSKGEGWIFWELNNGKYGCMTKEDYEPYYQCTLDYWEKIMLGESNPEWDSCMNDCMNNDEIRAKYSTGGEAGFNPSPFGYCSKTCWEKFPSKTEEDECGHLLFSKNPTNKNDDKECVQITEESVKYDGKFYSPRCKDNVILITYLCTGGYSEPSLVEIDCRNVEYGIGKTYQSCVQPSFMQGSCSKGKPILTLDEVKKKLESIKNNDNALRLYILDNRQVVDIVYDNKESLGIIDENGIDIWIKIIRMSEEMNKLISNAYEYSKEHGRNSMIDYVMGDEGKITGAWQLRLYNQIQHEIDQGIERDQAHEETQKRIEQIYREIEEIEREKFWEEDATFLDKLDYKIKFQAVREKGFSEIMNDPTKQFHEKVGEVSGILGYLPYSGDVIEIITLPSVLLDDNTTPIERGIHLTAALFPLVNAPTINAIFGIGTAVYDIEASNPNR